MPFITKPCFFLITRRPRSTLFPYTTLFRSAGDRAAHRAPAAITFVDGRRELGLVRSEEHTSELQSRFDLVCRLLLEKKKLLLELALRAGGATWVRAEVKIADGVLGLIGPET